MAKSTCTIEGCSKPLKGRGYCSMHWNRWKRHGSPHVVQQIHGDLERRFWSHVDKSGDCWLWTASTNGVGYGYIYGPDGKLVGAHRLAYELTVGPIPDGLHLDHLCRVTLCVNPAHLEPVTPRVNILRGESPSAEHARSDFCANGHKYTPENTRIGKGRRHCRQCHRERARIYYWGRKAA